MATDYERLFREARETYARAGITGRVGFGRKAVVVVVDLFGAFVRSDVQIGGADLTPVIMSNQRLLRGARAKGLPVVFTLIRYREDLADAGVWSEKVLSLGNLREGSPFLELDPRLETQPTDHQIVKRFPSAFFGTSLTTILTAQGVDTVIVTGTTTSGCVRATVVDALSHGYRVIVPRECVGDRAELPHVANLFDIDSKYGDVMELEEVLAAIGRM